MPHSTTKILFGSVNSSDREVTVENGAHATFGAGLAVRMSGTGSLSLSAADGNLIGISLGKPQTATTEPNKTAVLRAGNGVPIQLSASAVAVAGSSVYVSQTTGQAVTSGAGVITGGIYVSTAKSGVAESGADAGVWGAHIDMGGGL